MEVRTDKIAGDYYTSSFVENEVNGSESRAGLLLHSYLCFLSRKRDAC